jgi:DNA-binding CsgD family transcriptional regulator
MSAQRLHLRVIELADSLARIQTVTELQHAVMKLIAPLGYTAAASGRFGIARVADALHFANWKPEWIALYAERGYLRIDPVVSWAMRSGLPVTIDELHTRLPKEHPGHAVLAAARSYGYVGGIAVPQRAHDGTIGLVTFIGARDPTSTTERIALQSLACIVFEHAERLSGRSPADAIIMPPPALTAKEHTCLKHLVDGRSVAQIARLMKVSEATVRFHSANLRAKTGVSSRAELVAYANAHSLVLRN